ncbi:MAG TPA: VOC family protein [Chloroflexota bacterium]|nr:VOC family protein [Chloroflexota bacterium]
MSEQRGVKITGLAHWAIRVNDLEESRRFYTEILGMEDRGPVGEHFHCVRFGDMDLLLTLQPEELKVRRDRRDRTHIALRLSDEDFDRAARHMREWGVEVVPEEALNELQGDVEIRRRGVFVGRSFYILDPSGNRLELYSPTLPPDDK